MSPPPQHGDQIAFNSKAYVVQEVDVDIDGGAILKLRAM
jgi:hypothetical protein